MTTTVAYNADFGISTPLMIGLLAGREPSNNAGELAEVELLEQVLVQDGGATRTITRTRKVLRNDLGRFRESTAWKVKADLLFRPRFAKNRFGLDLFARWRDRGGESFFTPGIGAFLLKERHPKQSIAGITLRRADDKIGLRADLVTSL